MTKQVSTHHLIKLFFIIFLGTAATAAILIGITNWKAQTAKAASPRIAYWHLDEASGPTYADAEAGLHNGTCTNCPAAVTGPINGAQAFNGSTTTIDVPNDSAFNWGSGDTFAVEFWMQANSCDTSDEAFIGRGAAGGEQWFVGCNSTNGTVQFYLSDSTSNITLESTKVITDSNWHHLAVTYDGPGNTASLYVDGSDIVSTTTAFTGSFAPSANINIGHVDNLMHFNGNLDEIAIYNDIPTLTDFRTHYYLTRGYTESCTSSVKMMPLGDSITQGYASGVDDLTKQVSYRRDLWQLFNTNGYQVDYVGSLTNGEYYYDIEGFDPNHEGHPGWRDDQIALNIYNNGGENWLTNTPAEVILLHIGTNALANNPDDVEDILNEIDEYEADNNVSITVILARIINRVPVDSNSTAFNDNVQAMAEARIANGDKIIIVDMEDGAGLNYDLYPTGDFWKDDETPPYLHPYATGYTKMANVWFDALDDFMPYCPTPPTIASTPVTTGAKDALYTYDVDARSNIQPVTYTLTIYPTGMTITSTTGEISWTPVETGTVNVTVEVANNVGTTPQAFTITVDEPVSPTITTAAITTAVYNEPYVYDVDATGFPPPTFSLDPAAPGGMTIFTETGRIEWTPAITGTFDVTVTAANSAGTDSQGFTITVADAPVCPIDISTYWHLDANISDEFHESINNNDATCTGTTCPTVVTGKVNNAIKFDGTEDYLEVPYTTAFDWENSDSFSIELWVNTTQACTTNKVFIGKHSSDAAWWVGCGNGGNVVFSLRDLSGATKNIMSTTPITDSIGIWHHIVAIRDSNANENKLYIDGVEEANESQAYTGSFSNGSNLTMGNFVGAYFFEGMIDEAAIYNRALTDSEIQSHYANGTANIGYCTDTSPAFITSDPVTTVVTGEQYSYDVEATGFPTPEYSLTLSQTGMTIITQTGLIEWVPSTSGTYSVTVQATNSEGSDSQPFAIDVVDPTLPEITSLEVTSGYVNQIYHYDVDATGIPTPKYSLTVTPTGMTIDPVSGLIEWTPTSIGLEDVTVVATNSAGTSTPQTFKINVTTPSCPADLTSYWQLDATGNGIFTDTMSIRNATCTGAECPQIVAGKVGNAASFDGTNNGLWVAGDQTPYNWDVNDGFSIELWVKTGQDCKNDIDGKPVALVAKHLDNGASWWVGCTDYDDDGEGIATFSLRDSSGGSSSPDVYTVSSTTQINDGVSWHHIVAMYDNSLSQLRLYVDGNETTTTTNYDVNEQFYNNGTNTPITIGHLNDSYRLEGQLDEVALYSRALTEAEILQHYHNEVSYCASSAKPVIYSTAVTEASVGTPYSYDVNAVGITTPTYSFEGTPPTGMTIITQTGLIEWTTPIQGDHPISVKASNPAGDDIQNYTLTVSEKPVINSTPITIHELGSTYTYDVEATGYPGITYSVDTNPATSMDIINPNSGEFNWNPTITGIYNITVTAQNTAGQDQQNYDLTVGVKPTITSSPPSTTVELGSSYSYDVEATGFPTPISYALNTKPDGMTIDSNSGLISWTPGSTGTFNVIVAVSNDIGTTLHSFDIDVTAAPVIVSSAITKAVLNQLYVYDVEATGFPTPNYVLNTKPDGMTIDSNSGLISWTPGSTGTFNVIVAVSNDIGTTLHSFAIEVTQTLIAPNIVSVAVTKADRDELYQYDVEVTGFPNPTFELIESPDGMSIDKNSGLITWTPTEGGEHNVTVRAANSQGYIDQSFTITVDAQYVVFLPMITNP